VRPLNSYLSPSRFRRIPYNWHLANTPSVLRNVSSNSGNGLFSRACTMISTHQNDTYFYNTRVYQKVPRLDLWTRMYLLDLSLGSIPFKIVPSCSDTSIPAPLPLLERVLEVLFLKRPRTFCDSCWISSTLLKRRPSSCSFIFRKKSQGAKSGE